MLWICDADNLFLWKFEIVNLSCNYIKMLMNKLQCSKIVYFSN